jgi:hypothetical protein
MPRRVAKGIIAHLNTFKYLVKDVEKDSQAIWEIYESH